jgi:STE24 endopeptidase
MEWLLVIPPRSRRSGHWLAWVRALVASLAILAAVVSSAPRATAQDRLAPLLPGITAACGTCHAGPEPAGGLAIEGLFHSADSADSAASADAADRAVRELLVRMHDRVAAGEMPPEPEILAVMAHEIGHYAMNHIPKMLVMFGGIILFGFLFVQWAMRHLLARCGARWRLDPSAGVADVASLPLLAALFGTYLFLATPLLNTITRTQEIEADLYGLNLAREPHGEAEVLLKLTEYRKAEHGPVEEFIFYTHPSTRTRIYNAMRWREQMQPVGETAAKPAAK